MVIDTSALVAVLKREPERRSFIEAIDSADSARMSVASLWKPRLLSNPDTALKDCAIWTDRPRQY